MVEKRDVEVEIGVADTIPVVVEDVRSDVLVVKPPPKVVVDTTVVLPMNVVVVVSPPMHTLSMVSNNPVF